MPNLKWSELNHMQIGRYAEYLVKMELTSYKFDVYTSEVDDHGVDFIMKSQTETFYEVQVKAARIKNTSYIFASKDKFSVDNTRLLMAVVLFVDDELPSIYLIPSKEWKVENELFRDRTYIDKKSKPEWGLNISNRNLHLLSSYLIENMVAKLSI